MYTQNIILPNPPSLIEYKTLKFLIMDAPSTRLIYIILFTNEIVINNIYLTKSLTFIFFFF